MKREILFRGLRADGKGWVEGAPFFVEEENTAFIIDNCYSIRLESEDSSFTGFKVIPESVGQYTGLKGNNGLKIFEGDNLNPDLGFDEVEAVVRWDEDGVKFVVDSYGYGYLIGEGGQEIYSNELSVRSSYDLSDIRLEHTEVIGNIHQTK